MSRDERLMAILMLVESLRHLSRLIDLDGDPEELNRAVREMLQGSTRCLLVPGRALGPSPSLLAARCVVIVARVRLLW